MKILLIRLSALGDAIHTIPLANALKDAGHEIVWLTSEKCIDVLAQNPCLDKVILAPIAKWKKSGSVLQNFKEYLHLIKQLREEHFDIAIDVQMRLKSLLFMMFCGARRRIISKEAKELSILGGNEFIPKIKDLNNPVVLDYMKFANHLGIFPEEIKITLPERNNDVKRKVDELLKTCTKPVVVISPATTWRAKHWNKSYWKTVVEEIGDKCSLVFTGGPRDSELIDYISDKKHINLAGKTNLFELAEIFSRAKIVLSPDSGSAHLAWATQKPAVITIFTCTPSKHLAPLGDKDKYISVIGNLPCQPCFKHKCPLKTDVCTNVPKPDEIINIVNKLLSN